MLKRALLDASLSAPLFAAVLAAVLLTGCSTTATYRDPQTGALHECDKDTIGLWAFDLRQAEKYQACKTRAEQRGWQRVKEE